MGVKLESLIGTVARLENNNKAQEKEPESLVQTESMQPVGKDQQLTLMKI